MATMKLAQLLLRRKELQEKVQQLRTINQSKLFEPVVRRVNVTDSLDDVTAQIPLLTAAQVTKEFDMYASSLRQVDAAIQQANWDTDVTVPDETMLSYMERFPEESAVKPARKTATRRSRTSKKVASRKA